MPRGMLLVACAILSLIGAPTMPLAAPPDPTRFIFVASALDPIIAIIDSATDSVVSRTRLPGLPTQIAALNRGTELVASDAGARRLYVIDTASGSMKRELETGIAPVLLQADRTGSVLAVADPDLGVVELLHLAGGPSHQVPGLAGLGAMAFAPDGRLLVAHGSRIAVVDLVGRITAELTVDEADGSVLHVATDPGGEYAFAVQSASGVLSIFKLKELTKATQVRLPGPAGRLLPGADSQFVLITVAGGRALSIISTWTLKESERIPMSAAISSVGLGLLQGVSIGMSRASRTVQNVDLRERRRLTPLRMPGVPEAGTASPDGLKFYVALSDTGQVAVIDILQSTVSHVIEDVVRGASIVVPALGNNYCH